MITSEQTDELFKALVGARHALANPAKSHEIDTGKFRYKFAPLPDIIEQATPILFAAQLALIQEARTADGFAAVTTRIVHASGQWIEFAPLAIPSAADAQSIGSAVTYARRYALCAALGIAADEDDDGSKAVKNVGSGGGDNPTTAATTAPPDPATTGGVGVVTGKDAPAPLDAVIAKHGSSAKALLAARMAYGEGITTLKALTPDQLLELAG